MSTATKSSSSSSSAKSSSKGKVVALPSMTHSLSHLPNMHAVDPRYLHYGGLGASREASQAKLQQTLQHRNTASAATTAYGSSTHSQAHYYAMQPKSKRSDDGDYLMMSKGRKPA